MEKGSGNTQESTISGKAAFSMVAVPVALIVGMVGYCYAVYEGVEYLKASAPVARASVMSHP